MSTASYLDRILAPVSDVFTPEIARAVAAIRVDNEMQSYVESLATKANDGTITPEEAAEYHALIDAADLVSVLQIKSQRFLTKNP